MRKNKHKNKISPALRNMQAERALYVFLMEAVMPAVIAFSGRR
ncbi:MAG TPA: hypothetical protein PLO90_01655 [Clostridia bacterium]|jgi:hypothetical protein|nr:hypothetical protein [Clostridia bacterium]HQA98262.1 hypothetical protein [Clostridia bacterium]HQO56234.1 hypothetical protein [Clostridia bacterium]HUM61298.1 hypothetical protein [Clostridia bacterium]